MQQAEGRYTGHDPLVIDALDWYGTWKLFDGLTDAAFYNRNRQYALGATPEQTGMGQWSDGTPVKPIKVLKQPALEVVAQAQVDGAAADPLAFRPLQLQAALQRTAAGVQRHPRTEQVAPRWAETCFRSTPCRLASVWLAGTPRARS